jgi:hypothetical protein
MKRPDHLSEQKTKQEHIFHHCETATQRNKTGKSAQNLLREKKFALRQDTYHDTEYSYTRHRYVVTDGNLKIDSNVSRLSQRSFARGKETR